MYLGTSSVYQLAQLYELCRTLKLAEINLLIGYGISIQHAPAILDIWIQSTHPSQIDQVEQLCKYPLSANMATLNILIFTQSLGTQMDFCQAKLIQHNED